MADPARAPAGQAISPQAIFAVVYTTSVSSVYFALGVVAHRADGLTPVVFLSAGVFFVLSALTYAEGASLHRERGGSAVFARYAFNELVAFVAAWSVVLDYTILIAIAAVTVPSYLAVFYAPIGRGALELVAAFAVLAFVAVDNITGVRASRLRHRLLITLVDLALQVAIIVLGLAFAFDPSHLTQSIHLGSAPTVSGLLFALPVAVIAFTGLEAAASLSVDVGERTAVIGRFVLPGAGLIVLVYVGIAVVGVAALPVHHGVTELATRHVRAPLIGIVDALRPRAVADVLRYLVAAGGVLGLAAAAGAAMLGVSRAGYSLATNRQIPSAIGRLHPRWGTPVVVIALATLAAAALVVPRDLELLVGIYAFGAMLAFTIAHVSIVALRFREPDRPRGFRVPGSLRLGGVWVPLPAVLGGLLGAAGWISVLVLHTGARWVGTGWLAFGLALYLVYRTAERKPILRRVTIPDQALRFDTSGTPQFGSILVPILGRPIDDDIVQTAARLAGETRDDFEEEGAMIEAIWVVEMPLALPLDGPLPDAVIARARAALTRAKQVGEEYEGVQVSTAIVRARRVGEAIVREARRRGVEAIVLAAEEPSRVHGGPALGAGGPLDNAVGEITKHVIRKAPCRVILTAAPGARRAEDQAPASGPDPGRRHSLVSEP